MSGKREYKPGHTTPDNSAARNTQTRGLLPQYTGWRRVLLYCYIALTILSAIIVVGYIAFNLFSRAPRLRPNTVDPDDPTASQGRPNQVITTTDPSGNPVEVVIPGLSSDRKKEFYTFLLVGQDQGGAGGGDGGQTDTMILVAYDVPNQKLSLLSLPRDTWVSYRGNTFLLNSIYARYGAGDNGIKHLKQAVAGLTGVTPDFYVMVQWEAIGELVDAIDGVWFDVPMDMYYNDLSQHFKIDLKKGYQLLDGDKAMQLIRYRLNSDNSGHIDYSHGYTDGDIGRIRTQQAFLKATIAKCLQMNVLVTNLGEYVDIFQRNVTTDLQAGEIAYFVKSAMGGLNMDNVTFATLPYKDAGDGAHLLPLGSQIVRLVNENFNPYLADIRLYELTLADKSPQVKESEEPQESRDPEESPGSSADPEGSSRPGSAESPEPGSSEDPLEPPGTGESPGTSESGAPSESGSAESPEPSAAESAPPAEPSAAPPEEEPVPPANPGYFG